MRIICYGGFIDYQIQLTNALCKTEEVIMMLPLNELPEDNEGTMDKKVGFHILGRGKQWYHPTSLFILKDTMKMVDMFRPDVIHMQLGGSRVDLAFSLFLLGWVAFSFIKVIAVSLKFLEAFSLGS